MNNKGVLTKQRPYVQMYKDELIVWRKLHLSGSAWEVLMVIAERTWGWHKKEITLSHAEIAKDIGRTRRQVKRAIDSLRSASIVGWQGQERRKAQYWLNPPDVYTSIKAKLVTKIASDEANSSMHHSSVNIGDKKDTSTGDISGTKLVTSPSIKAIPLKKPLIKKEIKERKDDIYSEVPQGDNAPFGQIGLFLGKRTL